MNISLTRFHPRPWLAFCMLLVWCASLLAQPASPSLNKTDYTLGAGDTIRIQVFQNPDLSVEARVSESGTISFPLIGAVDLGGLSIAAGEKKIADALQKGGYLQKPQVNIVLLQIRGSQVAVLGQVAKPGRFPLETVNTRLSDVLAMAGGATPTGDDVVIVTGTRAGQAFRKQVDVPFIYIAGQSQDNILMQGGDTVYVGRAPMFYIYGEVQRPGAFRVERGMTVMQALAQGGGPTARGSERRLRLHRTQDGGRITQSVPQLTDLVQANDVIYVSESIF
ncbi:MAG: polysaccharide export protein EpsE [Burkholderiales bacterium]